MIRKRFLSILFAVGILSAGLLILHFANVATNDPPTVFAQSFEPFTRTFTIPASASVQYIPTCTTGQTGCIPNLKQIGHTVTEATTAGVLGRCGSLLDFSNDQVNWYTFAAGSTSTLSTQGITSYSANGYYNYYRIKLSACNVTQTVTYVGYSSPLPLQNISTAATDTIASVVPIISNSFTPFVIQSMSCLNTNGATAYLQFLVTNTNSTPALGTDDFLDIAIPANNLPISYPLNLTLQSLSQQAGYNYFWMGAATTFKGSTAVSEPVYCTFEFNLSGPYVPYNPPSS